MSYKIDVSIDTGAFAPTRAHEEDAGLDLKTPNSFTLFPGKSEVIDTGVHVAIPVGYAGKLVSKSGLNINHGILSDGLIDAGYTGSIRVKLYNFGEDSVNFEAGDKITQLVIIPVETPIVNIVDKISGGERGDNGFGSSGRK